MRARRASAHSSGRTRTSRRPSTSRSATRPVERIQQSIALRRQVQPAARRAGSAGRLRPSCPSLFTARAGLGRVDRRADGHAGRSLGRRDRAADPGAPDRGRSAASHRPLRLHERLSRDAADHRQPRPLHRLPVAQLAHRNRLPPLQVDLLERRPRQLRAACRSCRATRFRRPGSAAADVQRGRRRAEPAHRRSPWCARDRSIASGP